MLARLHGGRERGEDRRSAGAGPAVGHVPTAVGWRAPHSGADVADVADPPDPAVPEDLQAAVPEGLLARARELRTNAYAPYSGFRVGAVVVTASGRRFEGVNVENVSYRLTTCAEQAALAAMCAAGPLEEVVVVAVAGDGPSPCTPCGACRQTIAEFGTDAVVHATGASGPVLTTSIAELLPDAFTTERLRDRGEVAGGGA